MSGIRFPWDEVPASPPRPRARPVTAQRPRGRPKDAPVPWTVPEETAAGHTAWRPFRLTVAGPAATLAAFEAAAAGPGITPWAIDFAGMEEDLFHRLAARYPRAGRLSLEGCRAFAAQLRERAEDRQRRVLDAAENNRARPLDLHALLPVPPAILALGPDHPDARRWLRTHWGTEELRRVEQLPPPAGRRPDGESERRFGFFAAEAGPVAAVRRLGRAWPGLRLDLQPVPGGAG